MEVWSLSPENLISVLLNLLQSLSLYSSPSIMNEYLAIDSGGYLCINSMCTNCSVAESFPQIAGGVQLNMFAKCKI